MYNLISTIAERCHASATRRGKDTSWVSCIFALRDELADLLIVAATWNASAAANNAENFKPERDVEVMLASGAISFICSQIDAPRDVEMLRCMVNLKMRYNELREG